MYAVGNVCVSYGFSWRKGCGYLCHPVFESTDEPEIDPAVCNQKGHPLYEKAAELFENINAEYDKNTRIRDWYQVISVAACGGFDSILYPEYRGRCDFDRTCEKVKEVLSYINAHYMEELTISGLAGICFFSEYYFMRFFKKYMGMSCVQYVKNVRLERAADQFENGETNTLEAALSCGFSNLSYFHREFKRNME